ncbi:MAG: T9SS type A sorting domain-containing protein, partial [Bacteroidota bacterium]
AGNPWAGVESAQGVDLGTFEWDDDNRIVKIHVWKPIISDVGIKFATETGWAEEELKVANTQVNQWEELTFDFSNAINPPNPENGTLGQIIIFPDYAERDQDNIIYFDNITFGSGDDTSVSDINEDELTVYPNPIRSGKMVMFSNQVKQIDIFDVTGKLIQSSVNTSSVETNGMDRGVYFMRIQSENGNIQINQLIVK